MILDVGGFGEAEVGDAGIESESDLMVVCENGDLFVLDGRVDANELRVVAEEEMVVEFRVESLQPLRERKREGKRRRASFLRG